MKTFIFFLLVLLLYLPDSSRQALSDDARTILNSIQTVADPYSSEFLAEDVMTSSVADFAKKISPFADLFFTCVRKGLDKESKAVLQDLIAGMKNKLNDISQQNSFDVLQYSKNGQYDEHVTLPFDLILDHIEMATYGGEKRIEVLANYCTKINLQLAMNMLAFAQRCENKTVNAKANSAITELLGQFYYSTSKLTTDEEFKFRDYYFTLYEHFSTDHGRYLEKINQFVSKRTKYVKHKAELLKEVVVALALKEESWRTGCLPLNAFVHSRYDRSTIEHFIILTKGHLHLLQFVTAFCSRSTEPNSPKDHADYLNVYAEKISVITRWTSSWASSLLESTWPNIERDLVVSYMNEKSRGYPIKEDTNEYGDVLYFVKRRMRNVGHQRYRKGYLLHSYDLPPLRSGSYHLCDMSHPNTCAVVSSNNAQCMITRTDISSGDVKYRLERLTQFRKKIEPFLSKSLERKYWKIGPLRLILENLADKEGIDFTNFTHHSSFAVVRYSRYLARCTNFYALETEYEQGVPYIQEVQYHNDGKLWSRCHHFTFFIGV